MFAGKRFTYVWCSVLFLSWPICSGEMEFSYTVRETMSKIKILISYFLSPTQRNLRISGNASHIYHGNVQLTVSKPGYFIQKFIAINKYMV